MGAATNPGNVGKPKPGVLMSRRSLILNAQVQQGRPPCSWSPQRCLAALCKPCCDGPLLMVRSTWKIAMIKVPELSASYPNECCQHAATNRRMQVGHISCTHAPDHARQVAVKSAYIMQSNEAAITVNCGKRL